jgi:PAS domain S-box-containing protein
LVAVSAYIESDYSFGLFVDITEQRRLEQAIRESEENLRAIGDNIPKGLIFQMLIEKDGISRFTYVSQNVEQLHEWKAEEVIANQQLLFSRVVPDDVEGLRRATEKSIKEMSVFDHTLRIKRKSGEIRWHRMISSPRKLVDGHILFNGIEIDITEQKRAEININKYSDELKKLNANKDLFIQILAHDLRNPFNALLGFSDVLINNIHEYSKVKIEEILRIIHQTSHKTFNLLDDLLLWSKSQSGVLSFQPAHYYFIDICNEILELMRTFAEEKNIRITCSDQDKIEIFVDIRMFKTILRNLISNAIKYSNTNGQININAERVNENNIITVTDNGVGIGKENISQLFEVKNQFTTKGTAGESGTGFGLTLCKEFIEKHEGKIWVESEAGKGSDFKFSIPINNV